MLPRKQFDNPTFAFVAKGLVDLHRLIKAGQEDSPEAEAIRNALDGPLAALNPAEKQRAQWLSEDLYSISEPADESALKPMNPQAQQQLNEAYEARQRGDLDYALALLRRWKDYISPALLSYLRGTLWREFLCPEVATVFFEHASQREPTNSNFLRCYLYGLTETRPDAAATLATKLLDRSADHDPSNVSIAASILYKATAGMSLVAAEQVCRDLIRPLKEAVLKLQRAESEMSVALGPALVLLGACQEALGDTKSAFECYSQAIQVSPGDDSPLIARGILRYGKSPSAIEDLASAAHLSSTAVWPYLFLAHHYLSTQQYDRCRITCERGLLTSGSDVAKSQLEEWRAIAQSELGFSPDLVRTAFEAAIRLDPSNEQAKRNLARFEEALASDPRPQRLTWEQRSDAAIRNFGLAERRFSLAA